MGPMTRLRWRGRIAAALLVCAVVAAGGALRAGWFDGPAPIPPYRVGAHYYLWYPENLREGMLRPRLLPPQQPVAADGARWYRSDDVAAAERHIAMASRYGIGFFALDWWPRRPWYRERIDTTFLKAANIGDVKFAIQYELWNLGFVPGREETPFDQEKVDRFGAEVRDIARRYFGHPSYLKVDGRPVLFVYLSRTATGMVGQAMTAARAAAAEEGYNLFAVGDEIFWRTTRLDGGTPPLSTDLQLRRMGLFDALFAYNLYESEMHQHAGYAANTPFLADTAALYDKVAAAGTPPLVPHVMPGYNDRAVRRIVDHFIIPREYEPGAGPASFLTEYLRQVALPRIDPSLGMLLVTTWNEWNEDTGIEPIIGTVPTDQDWTNRQLLTKGYTYVPFGDAALAALRDRVAAVAGRVTGGRGEGIAGREVCAVMDGRRACGMSDRAGYYTISRRGLGGGEAELTVDGDGERTLMLPADGCLTGIDLTVP